MKFKLTAIIAAVLLVPAGCQRSPDSPNTRDGVEFATTNAPMQYAALNSQTSPDVRFYKESELTPEMAAVAFGADAGQMSGPSLVGNTYTVSRLAETRMMPDSLGARHILLQPGETALADSLMGVIRRGSDFATLALEYSQDQSVTMNSGDLGRFSPNDMVPEFSDAILNHRVGEIFTVESAYGIHIIESTYKSPLYCCGRSTGSRSTRVSRTASMPGCNDRSLRAAFPERCTDWPCCRRS